MPVRTESGAKAMSRTLIRGAAVLTMDAARSVYFPGYVLYEDGRILEAGEWPADGSKDELLSGCSHVIEADGKAVIPGLVNAHTHLVQTFMRGVSDDMPLAAWLRQVIWPACLAMDKEDFYLAALVGCIENLKTGATYIMDHHYIHTFPDNDAAVLQAMADSGLRGHMARGGVDLSYEPRLSETPDDIFRRTERLLERWHGAESGRIEVAMGPLNLYGCSKPFLEQAARYSRERDIICHIHVAETREQIQNTMERFGLRNLELVEAVGMLSPKTQVVHGIWLDDNELESVRSSGASVVHCPVSNMYLASGVARVPEMLRLGINVALGTDGPGSNNSQDNLEVLKFAACLHKVANLDAELLPPMQVLEMATMGGARAMGRERELGSIEPGKLADLVIVDLNKPHIRPVHRVSSALVYNANGGDVDTVIVGGRTVVERGRCVLIDEEAVLRRAQVRVDALRRKLAPDYPAFGVRE